MALSISGNLIIDEEFRTPSTGTNTENEVPRSTPPRS
jgi:hypothetical protein